MTGTALTHTIAAAGLAFLLHSAPTEAQLLRTWVASNGDNSNPCSRAQPCATFQAAIDKTNAGGEVNCVDAGEYGGAGITKPLTIDCAGTLAGISSGAGSQPILVSISEATFPDAVVRLRNLTVNAAGVSGNGIVVQAGGAEVHIENCSITGVGQADAAIFFIPSSSVDLFVRDTFIGGNISRGIRVAPFPSTVARVSLNKVRLDHNSVGISVVKATATAGTAVVVLEDVQIENSTGIGIEANGAGTFVFLSNSTVTLNGTAFSAVNSGKIFSFGNNTIAANASVGSTPTALQQQ